MSENGYGTENIEETQITPSAGGEEKIVYVQKNYSLLAASILISTLVMSGTLVYVFGSGDMRFGTLATVGFTLPPFAKQLPYPQAVNEDGDVVLGNPNAPVEIVEFGDYQCPFCARFFSTTEGPVRENYIATGKVKMVFKDLVIIDSFVGGRESYEAALSANCAADQGKFWEYHDALFIVERDDGQENNRNLTRDLFVAIADTLDLDQDAFVSCLESEKYKAEVEDDGQDAEQSLPRLSTPSSLVNGQLASGALPYDQFSLILDAAFAAASNK